MANFTIGFEPDGAQKALKNMENQLNEFGSIAGALKTACDVCAEHSNTLGISDTLKEFMTELSPEIVNMRAAMQEAYDVLNAFVKGTMASQAALQDEMKNAMRG